MSEAAVHENPTGSVLFPRLGSVLALAPLGVWTTWHLWQNLVASRSDEAWQHTYFSGSAAGSLVTSLVVFAPLVIHTLWGLRRLKMASVNKYSYFGNLKYIVQRVSAVGLLGFLAAHITLARIKPALNGTHETFEDLAAHMRHHPPTTMVYVLGVLGTAYHLANGVYTSFFINGLAASPQAARRMQVISLVFFAFLVVVGLGAIAQLYNAGAAFSPPVD